MTKFYSLLILLSIFNGLNAKLFNFSGTNCPDGSILSFDKTFCYYFISKPMDFVNSEGYCMNIGGHLVSIHNVFDNIDLFDKAKKIFLSADEFGTGGNKVLSPGNWSWTDNSQFNYNDWALGEPINSDLRKCLHLDLARGMWYAADCLTTVPFVCQVNASSTTIPPTTTTTTTTIIPSTTTSTLSPTATSSAKPCVGVIFVAEMTEVIGQQRKEIFLNATKILASNLHKFYLDKLQFSLGLTGQGVLWPIQLQDYSRFDDILNSTISEVTTQNEPNSAESFYKPILSELLNVTKSGNVNHYLVVVMGETERIQDASAADDVAKQLAKTDANIFVLDATNGDFGHEFIFQNLVGNDPSKITKWSNNFTAQSLANDFNDVLKAAVQIWDCK